MPSRNRRRLQRVERAVASLPIPRYLLRDAYEHFRETGELPEEQRVAADVVRCVRSGVPPETYWSAGMDRAAMIRAYLNAPARIDDGLTDPLLAEAVWAPEPLRAIARHVLAGLVDVGRDVTQPIFVGSDIALPEFGSVGLHLVGFPHCFVKAPYEQQAERLFARYAELRDRIDQDDQRWFEHAATAAEMLRSAGELPQDDLLRDAVLADLELCALIVHAKGDDVSELMAVCDAAAHAVGEQREAAIERVRVLVR